MVASSRRRCPADLDDLGRLPGTEAQEHDLAGSTGVSLIEQEIAETEVHRYAVDEFERVNHVGSVKDDCRGPGLHGGVGISALEATGLIAKFATAVQDDQNGAKRIFAPRLRDERGYRIGGGQRDVTPGRLGRA